MDRRRFLFSSISGTVAAGLLAGNQRDKETDNIRRDETAFKPSGVSGEKFIDLSGPEAMIGGYPVSWLEKHYDLPLHVYHSSPIVAAITAYKTVFQELYPKGEIRFAAKSNPQIAVLKVMAQEGIGADVTSDNEAQSALDGGVLPKNIEVNGNAKSDALIRLAISKDMILICNDTEEFLIISQIAREMNATPRVMLRICGFAMGTSKDVLFTTSGWWTKFGCSISSVKPFFKLLAAHPHMRFIGFHTHVGSQVIDLEPYLHVTGKLIELTIDAQKAGFPCTHINIGGGFPVNYLEEREWSDIKEKIRYGHERALKGDTTKYWVWGGDNGGFRIIKDAENPVVWTGKENYTSYPREKMLRAILSGTITVKGRRVTTIEALKEIGEPTFVIEPGRSLVEKSGITLTRVVQVRRMNELYNLVTIDAGVTSFGGLFSNVPVNKWAVANDLGKKDVFPFETFIAGNQCYSTDLPARYKVALIRKPKRGDVLLTHDTGAYSAQFYASNTNLHARPARVLILRDGSVVMMKHREKYEEIVS
ncbi:MAG: hypothetical protein HZC28_06425 [Spirochaetes bacterium]|nr:hypothetical protein [Spirochaetota bacterium]